MALQIDTEKTKQTIASVLDRMLTEADPWLLDEYHRLFKKEVSLFHRSKVAAYLLMLSEQGKNPRPGRTESSSRKNGTDKRAGGGSRSGDAASANARPVAGSAPGNGAQEDDAQRYPLSEEESKRLFFSVGRSRRVFPREILGLINSKTAIPREDIGAIRILDNYSFVQVRDTVAEQIIEALNGLTFRGRPLTVNYAKTRTSEEASEQEQNDPDKENV